MRVENKHKITSNIVKLVNPETEIKVPVFIAISC